MSRFYASINGSASTEAIRRGTPASGVSGHIRGWDLGAFVECEVDTNGRDIVTVWITGGSNDRHIHKHVGTWYRDDEGNLVP